MSITSADVARAAGVSRATVSYVLNDVPGKTITEATRTKVWAAADRLGYRPNVLARSLKRGRTDTLVLPMPGRELHHVMAQLLAELTSALAEHGLKVVPDFTQHTDPERQVEAWLSLAPAAVLDLLLHHGDPALALLRTTSVHVLSAGIADRPAWESTGDEFARAQRLQQVRYLVGKGHRHLVAVYPRDLPIDRRALRLMETGMTREAKRAGARLDLERLDLDELAGAILEREQLPDAFACHNDEYAFVVLSALQRRGVRVPEDVAVMGIDDLPISSVLTPSITSIRADVRSYARAAVEAVLAGLAGESVERALPQVAAQIVERESA